jgi:hypothetical protein
MHLPAFALAPLQPADPFRPALKAGMKQKTEGAGMGKDEVNFSFRAPPPMDPFTAARFAVLGMPDPKVKR